MIPSYLRSKFCRDYGPSKYALRSRLRTTAWAGAPTIGSESGPIPSGYLGNKVQQLLHPPISSARKSPCEHPGFPLAREEPTGNTGLRPEIAAGLQGPSIRGLGRPARRPRLAGPDYLYRLRLAESSSKTWARKPRAA
jgi:hypothetical protein